MKSIEDEHLGSNMEAPGREGELTNCVESLSEPVINLEGSSLGMELNKVTLPSHGRALLSLGHSFLVSIFDRNGRKWVCSNNAGRYGRRHSDLGEQVNLGTY